jgi:hypothetical protein
MTSAANNQGCGPNWGNPNWNNYRGPWGGHYWGMLPPWLPPPALRGAAIAMMILGFIFFWPIGLAILAFLIFSKRACGWGRWGGGYAAWQGQGPAGQGPGAGRGQWSGGGNNGWPRWGGGSPPSSGNRAFDDYRAETLKRLEEEQKEFGEFLDRLRFAKDKAEFDQFMTERRNHPPETPPAPPGQPTQS